MFGGVFQNISDMIRAGNVRFPRQVQTEPNPRKGNDMADPNKKPPSAQDFSPHRLTIDPYKSMTNDVWVGAASSDEDLSKLSELVNAGRISPADATEYIMHRDTGRYGYMISNPPPVYQPNPVQQPATGPHPHPSRKRLEESDAAITELKAVVERLNNIIRSPDKLILAASLHREGIKPVFDMSDLRHPDEQDAKRQMTEVIVGMTINATIASIERIADKIDGLGMFKVEPVIRNMISKHAEHGISQTDLPAVGTTQVLVRPV